MTNILEKLKKKLNIAQEQNGPDWKITQNDYSDLRISLAVNMQ